jgi:hypothetical protein
VKESTVQGRGVFLDVGQSLQPGEIVTKYAGSPRWATEDEVEALENPKYVFSWDGGVHHDGNWWHILWDGVDYVESWDAHCIGHFYNSTHPSFEPPWKSASCAFGLFFGPSFSVNVNVPPDVELFIVAMKRVQSRRAPVELSLDYHHVLTEQLGRWCGDWACMLCHDSMRRFVGTWSRKISNQKKRAKK